MPHRFWNSFLRFLPLVIAVHLALNWVWQLYGQLWEHASVQEARRILLAGGTSAFVLLGCNVFARHAVPLSVLALGAGTSVMLQGASRFQS